MPVRRVGRRRGEEGLTLVEVVVTVVILGVAFGVIVGGIGTGVVMTDFHRKQADSQVVLRNLAEFVKDARFRRPVCPGQPADYRDLLVAFATSPRFQDPPTRPEPLPEGYDQQAADAARFAVSIPTGTEYWNGTGYGATPPADFTDTCADNGLQRLTLQVRSLKGGQLGAVEELQVVKRVGR